VAVGAGVIGTAGMFFGSVTGMSSMSPQMTPWMGATPGYGASSMSPGKFLLYTAHMHACARKITKDTKDDKNFYHYHDLQVKSVK
jgi:hypothetical protein